MRLHVCQACSPPSQHRSWSACCPSWRKRFSIVFTNPCVYTPLPHGPPRVMAVYTHGCPDRRAGPRPGLLGGWRPLLLPHAAGCDTGARRAASHGSGHCICTRMLLSYRELYLCASVISRYIYCQADLEMQRARELQRRQAGLAMQPAAGHARP